MAAEVKTVIKPLGDRVVVKRIEEEPKTKGGIVLPDTAKEKPQKGKVIAVGTGRVLENGQRVPLEVKEGDMIRKSQVVGRVGSTGRSTGPHLHWSVRLIRCRVDPMALIALTTAGSGTANRDRE